MADTNQPQTQPLGAILAEQPTKRIDYRALGTTGLRQHGGIINESSLRGLDGLRAMEIFKEMGDDATIGAVLFMVNAMIRSVKWPVVDASRDPKDLEAGDFIRSVLDDMEVPWTDVISEIMSFVQYGFSLHEMLFKRRAGRADEPWLRSKYQDGRIGLRGLPIRSQDTIIRWKFDEAGTVVGAVQQDPYNMGYAEIPMSKALLFRTTAFKGNPEGESFCRRAYVPWYFKKSIQQSQAIGISRDLCGLPVFRVPGAIMHSKANPAQRAEFNHWKKIGTRLRNDEQAVLFMPSDRDEVSKELKYDVQLMASGGARAHNLPQIISDLRTEIFDTAMAGHIAIGQGQNSGGSFALHSDKTELFLLSLTAYMQQICNVINLNLIPLLLDINGMEVTDYPEMTHSPLERRNLKDTVEALAAAQQVGAPIFGGPEGEAVTRRILEWSGMQVTPDEARTAVQRENLPVTTADANALLVETHNDTPKSAPNLSPDELRRMGRPIFRGDLGIGQAGTKVGPIR